MFELLFADDKYCLKPVKAFLERPITKDRLKEISNFFSLRTKNFDISEKSTDEMKNFFTHVFGKASSSIKLSLELILTNHFFGENDDVRGFISLTTNKRKKTQCVLENFIGSNLSVRTYLNIILAN